MVLIVVAYIISHWSSIVSYFLQLLDYQLSQLGQWLTNIGGESAIQVSVGGLKLPELLLQVICFRLYLRTGIHFKLSNQLFDYYSPFSDLAVYSYIILGSRRPTCGWGFSHCRLWGSWRRIFEGCILAQYKTQNHPYSYRVSWVSWTSHEDSSLRYSAIHSVSLKNSIKILSLTRRLPDHWEFGFSSTIAPTSATALTMVISVCW